MTKKAKISFLVLIWSIVAVQMYVNYLGNINGSEQVVTAFSVVEEEVLGETIRGYGYFGTMFLSEDTKKSMLKNLALKLGITDGYKLSEGQGDHFSKMMLIKEGKYATTTLQIISMGEENEPEQYIMVQIETTESVESAFTLYEKVKRFYEEIGVEGQVSMEVEMERQGNMLNNQEENLVEELFDLAKAKTVDIINENGIYTAYGYTKLEDSYLELNGEKVNVQIVMSYNEEKDKTYMKAGIPIVNTSY